MTSLPEPPGLDALRREADEKYALILPRHATKNQRINDYGEAMRALGRAEGAAERDQLRDVVQRLRETTERLELEGITISIARKEMGGLCADLYVLKVQSLCHVSPGVQFDSLAALFDSVLTSARALATEGEAK